MMLMVQPVVWACCGCDVVIVRVLMGHTEDWHSVQYELLEAASIAGQQIRCPQRTLRGISFRTSVGILFLGQNVSTRIDRS